MGFSSLPSYPSNRATLAVAMKMVALMLAVEYQQTLLLLTEESCATISR